MGSHVRTDCLFKAGFVSVTSALVLQHKVHFGLAYRGSAQNSRMRLGRVLFMGITNKIILTVIIRIGKHDL